MDGTTRLILVGGAVALVVYFGWPYVRGDLGEVGRQLSGDNRRTGFPPMLDPFGLMPGQGEREASPSQRLRLPDGVGNADDRPPPPPPPRDRYQQQQGGGPGIWRICRDDRSWCSPWQSGPKPDLGR